MLRGKIITRTMFSYSNCLISAVALKLKHWRTVKIIRRSGYVNFRIYGCFCPHFYAFHKGYEYHFHTDKNLVFPQYFGLFKGYLVVKKAQDNDTARILHK